MTNQQLSKLVLFYKKTFEDNIAVEEPLMAECKKAVLEIDKLKVTNQDITDTKEYLDELNYLLDRLY